MAFAATASGGETIAPSAKQAGHANAGAKTCTVTATATVVNATAPSTSDRMLKTSRRKSDHAV